MVVISSVQAGSCCLAGIFTSVICAAKKFGFRSASPRRNLYDLRIMIPTFDKEDKWTAEIEIPVGGKSSEGMELWTEQGKWSKVVAFTGQFNAGKTMILCLLTDREFPSGGKVSTLGISAVYVPDQDMVLLDSAGTDFVQTDHLADMGADTLEEFREHFCSDVLMDMSDNFVHVVGKLDRPAMRSLWAHLARISKTKKRDFTIVYNLYPHSHDLTVVKDRKQKIIEGYGDSLESEEDWTFITCHNEGSEQVLVHHWFWLDDNWSTGHKINLAQIPKFWERLQTLDPSDKNDGKSTQDITIASLANITPRYMVPQGSTCEVTSQEITMDPQAKLGKPYNTSMKVDVNLLLGARMQHVILVPNLHGQFVQAHDGFQPGVRRFCSAEGEHWILVDAPNCVLADASNLPKKFQYSIFDARQPKKNEGVISIKMTTSGQWRRVHISITKVPYLKVEDYERDDGYAAEQQGEFSLYHPPKDSTGFSSTLEFCGGELTNGLLVVQLKPVSNKPPWAPPTVAAREPSLPSLPENYCATREVDCAESSNVPVYLSAADQDVTTSPRPTDVIQPFQGALAIATPSPSSLPAREIACAANQDVTTSRLQPDMIQQLQDDFRRSQPWGQHTVAHSEASTATGPSWPQPDVDAESHNWHQQNLFAEQ